MTYLDVTQIEHDENVSPDKHEDEKLDIPESKNNQPLPTFGAFEALRKRILDSKQNKNTENRMPNIPRIILPVDNTLITSGDQPPSFRPTPTGMAVQHTPTLSALNNEWDRILGDIEKGQKTDVPPSKAEVQKKKDLVISARKRYLRQLIKNNPILEVRMRSEEREEKKRE